MPLFFSRSVGIAAASLAEMLAAGCSNDTVDCSLGAETPEAALSNFLAAAHTSDLEAMRSHVFPLPEVTSADLDAASETLGAAEPNDLVLWRNELKPGHYAFRATTAEDQLLGQWEVGEMEEPHLGCYAVSWGAPTSDSDSLDPTPSATAEPAA